MTQLRSKLLDWFKFWWLKIPEPRSYSMIFAIVYFVSIIGGSFILLYPPATMLGEAGPLSMAIIGILLIVGGIIGAISGTREAWRLERIGVLSIMIGLSGYFTVVLHTAYNHVGYQSAQLVMVIFSGLLFVARLAMIWQYSFKPNTNRIFQVSPQD